MPTFRPSSYSYGAAAVGDALPYGGDYGGFGERRKMGDKYRKAVVATVLTYIDTARSKKKDPLKMKDLSFSGCVLLGAELPVGAVKKPGAKDSVWWVTLSVRGKPAKYTKLGDDLSKWRRKLNKQLKTWGQESAVKKLAHKRAVAGGIIAAVVVAVVVATILTAGAAGAFAPGAAAAGGGAASGGAAAGGTAAAASSANAALMASGSASAANAAMVASATGAAGAASGGGGLAAITAAGPILGVAATAAQAAMPGQAAAMEAEALVTASDVETAVDEETGGWIVPAAVGLSVVGVGVALLLVYRNR